MNDFYHKLIDALKSNGKVVIARIIGHKGSVPRTTGTKCLILEDGSTIGTVGGGLLEYEVMQTAKDIFRDGRPRRLRLDLESDDLARAGMICGGRVDVYLELIRADSESVLNVFESVAAAMDKGSGGILASPLVDGSHLPGSCKHVFFNDDGTVVGGLDSAGDMFPGPLKFDDIKADGVINPGNEKTPVFVEVIRPAETIWLFGAGHVSFYVAPLARMVGFRVVVIDDRSEFANRSRFPDAGDIRVTSFSEVFDQITVTASSYLLIITRGHDHDETVLRKALQSPAGYIGMIGSKRKRDAIYDVLKREGVESERLEQVHCPIGLEIQAETPQEIAFSIVGELILERAKHKKGVKKMI